MLQTGEFNHSHIVAAGFQLKPAEPVGEILGEPILENSIFKYGLVKVVSYLTEELMLAARDTEDDFGTPLHCVDKGIVGSRIAGMEGDHHVSMVIGIVGNVAH